MSPSDHGGAVVSTPDPLRSLHSLALSKLSLSSKAREVAGSNPVHGVHAFFASLYQS